ncbi:hypothetical protein GL218_05498 [Daldinia childiae]|uniref:uncharacterized protein n=1 Tax=Daldinia childiae TaxID=326645 RepID=UPI0014489226|nr:uncharacterized protein GL218_05498 [Daldinia childiae]KAF3058373.1 hypothetical protein GL218_05498 [Daldinia childiae]
MGFTTGFTGGVTLTLSVAYLGVLAHQRHRERQAAILRQQTRLISGIIDPLPPVLPPTRAELAAAERANLIERAKDRWNAEIEGAVHWAQNKDWEEVRENVEIAFGRLWARTFGDVQGPIEKGDEVAANVKAVANTKLDQGKEKASSVAAAAKSAYADAKAKGSEVVGRTEEKAKESKGSFLGGLASSIWKSKDAVDKTKSAVPPFDQSDPQAAMKYQEEHHQKHVEQHQDREQQREQEQKQSQPSHHRHNSKGVNNPGPSQQRPYQSTRSHSTATRIPGPLEYPSRPSNSQRGAVGLEEWVPHSFTSPSLFTSPPRTNIQQDVKNTMDQADKYSATALVNADEEASAIVQANSPRSWTSSSSSGHASVSTLTTISRGVAYDRHRRRDSYESGSGSGSVHRKLKKGGFRAWVSRHLRD